ncbi:hypothetical protein BpHYR1_049455 [Brachionus plicatilis]|uniref:Uncharacterized protein n=1 Tax=Brachionus plicatilis TaxID=10195 RepID=A0A3M7R2A4_BRAPC|nr:hypothetical protein BpHYR1_049455 [Brachionus plicatilis]
MFTREIFAENYDKEKLKILQNLNSQIQSMALKLDLIVSHAEENIFKIKSSNSNNFRNSLLEINNSLEIKPVDFEKVENGHQSSASCSFDLDEEIKLADHHQLVKIIDQKPQNGQKKNRKINKNKQATFQAENKQFCAVQTKPEPNTVNKRSKQQRIFNTFVRESINQLLGPDFMRTHDVQDIDSQVMEMIRKEALEHYLPDNIRPRRAWHLAKASLRTLKRTLNNRKPKLN